MLSEGFLSLIFWFPHLFLTPKQGLGVTKNVKRAVELFTKSSDQENRCGQANLAKCYEKGKGGLPKNLVKAYELYGKSAAQDNPDAIYALGLMYEKVCEILFVFPQNAFFCLISKKNREKVELWSKM